MRILTQLKITSESCRLIYPLGQFEDTMPSNKKQKEVKEPTLQPAKPPQNKSDKGDTDTKPDAKLDPPKPPFIVYNSRDELKLIESFGDSNDIICSKQTILVKSQDKDDRVESVCCSEDGQYVAWCDKTTIKCLRFENQEIVFDQPNDTRSNCLTFSPRSTKLVTFNTMAGGDNLHFWDLFNQKRLASMPFKKASQWKPVFSMNEDVCLQHVNSELIIYSSGVFDKPKHRLSHFKVNAFSLSSASFEPSQSCQHIYAKRTKIKNHFIAIYSAGAKAQPSIVKIYKYPNMTDCIANKSFFKADSVKFSWSPSGTSMLLICQSDFDKSGKSYYGEQSLNYLNVKGESYFVKLAKEGAISHLEWYPSCDQEMFICVYGLMPAKVSLFNNKCEVLFNFGDQGSFNEVKFNPFGTLLAVYGFGNLAGQLCIWDFEKKKLLTSVKVPETTGIEWCADGKHILTCTTSPRLRVGNGYRLWHYSGSLIYENAGHSDSTQNLELFDVIWQPKPNAYKKPKIDSKSSAHTNLLSQSKLNKFQSSAGKYIPPSERNAASKPKPNYLDSAIGLTAGNRPIVGLASLTLKDNVPNKPKKTKSKGIDDKTNKSQVPASAL